MRNVALIVLLSADSLSITCSLLTLWTIYRVGRWNGYTKLVFHLAIAQLFYDLSTLLVPIPGNLSYSIYVGYRSIFGMATTLFTNVIAGTVVYTVYSFQPFEVSKHLPTLIPMIYFPSTVIGILVGIFVHSHLLEIFSGIYFWVRVLSISFNILSYLFVTLILSNTTTSQHTNNIHATYNENLSQQMFWGFKSVSSSAQHDPLRAFVRRFQYYPLIQVLCRVAVSWYEYVYGYSYNYQPSHSSLQQILLFFYVIFLPSLGTFYFLIFITVSPSASKTLTKDIHTATQFLLCRKCCVGITSLCRSWSRSRSIGSQVGGSGSGSANGSQRDSVKGESEMERRSTMMSLYRHFMSERISSVDRHEGMSSPLQRPSTVPSNLPPVSRPVSSNLGAGYEEYDEEELTKEIRRFYDPTTERTTSSPHSSLQPPRPRINSIF
jgi:hypothetical protein